MLNFKTSQLGIDLIKESEGFRSNAYQDSVGVWTIGYGTILGVKKGDVISLEEAENKLIQDLVGREKTVNANVASSINQNQFDACIDFCYNLGNASFVSSTLLKKININPEDPSIAQEFAKWVHAGTQILPGLVVRRKKESDLYFTSVS